MPQVIEIAPSILSADFARLGEEIRDLEQAEADLIHLDIMDGHFVPNITFGPPVVKALRPLTKLTFDAHLMISPADPYIEAFAKAGVDILTVHPEANQNILNTLNHIKSFGIKAGVALNPETTIDVIEGLLDQVDQILIMTVNPGFGGQGFMAEQLTKIETARKMIDQSGRNIVLEVDGGINTENAPRVIAAGATRLVAGTAIFKDGRDNYAKNIADLRRNI